MEGEVARLGFVAVHSKPVPSFRPEAERTGNRVVIADCLRGIRWESPDEDGMDDGVQGKTNDAAEEGKCGRPPCSLNNIEERHVWCCDDVQKVARRRENFYVMLGAVESVDANERNADTQTGRTTSK
jgi:hypothetical protein